MIDPADKQTQAIPLDEQPTKKRRGRPATGKAMTPAEKQRAYRERLKRNVTDINSGEREQLHDRIAELLVQNDKLNRECNKLKKALEEEKSNKGNVTKVKRHRDDNVLERIVEAIEHEMKETSTDKYARAVGRIKGILEHNGFTVAK